MRVEASRVSAQHPAPPDGVEPARPAEVLGDRADDPAVRAVVDLVLTCPAAMAYAHGPDHLLLYNAPYAASLGAKHPEAYGRPAREVFGEVWDIDGFGEAMDAAFHDGTPFFAMDSLVPLSRGEEGTARPPSFTRTCSPVHGSDGQVVGTLTMSVETTQAVTAVDRLARLSSVLSDAVTVDDVVRATLRHAVTDLERRYVRIALQDPTRDGWVTVRASASDLVDPATERLPPLWQTLRARPEDAVLGDLAATAARGHASTQPGSAHVLRGRVRPAEVLQRWLGATADALDRQVPCVALFPFELAEETARRPGDRGRAGFVAYGCTDAAPDAAELLLLEGCAELVGRALRRARVLELERSAAQLLQRSLLPDNLPQHDHLLVAARHEPGAAQATVGGDFYDAFEVAGGRVALVLGDAMGQGVLASSVMGQVRSAIRAVALDDPAPQHVLQTCSDLFESMAASSDALGAGHFVTVCYVVLDPMDGVACVASAGHLPPVVRPAAAPRDPYLLELPVGPPLGLGGDRPGHEFRLEVGDLLLLLTDGLVERRDESLTTSFAQLLEEVAQHPDADPLVLCSALLQRYGPETSDDVALLAASRTESRFRTARTVLPAEASAARVGRRWLAEVLAGWGVERRVGDLEVALSEVVTNAVVHARSRAEVAVRAGMGKVLVTVSDRGSGGDALPRELPLSATRGRGLAIVGDVTDAWGAQRTTSGQRVWFEVSTDRDRPPAGRDGDEPRPLRP